MSSQSRGKHYGTALNPYGGSASAFGSLAEGPGKWNGKEHQGTIRKNLDRLMPHYWGVGIGVSSFMSLGTAAVPEPWRKQSAHPVRTASQGLNCEFGQMLQ